MSDDKFDLNDLEDEFKPFKDNDSDKQNERPPSYVSKDGFVTIPIKRGFTEIEELYNAVYQEDKSFICGGYVRYMGSPKGNPYQAVDVDVYSETEEEYKRLKEFFHSKFLEIKHENNMAVTYHMPAEGSFSACPAIQLIKPIIKGKVVAKGNMEEILENFDFTVVRVAIKNKKEILADADFLHDEEKSLLRLKNIHCPISSTMRCVKYGKKGYYLSPLQTIKLFVDWDARDDEYRANLLGFADKMINEGELTQKEFDEFEEMLRID